MNDGWVEAGAPKCEMVTRRVASSENRAHAEESAESKQSKQSKQAKQASKASKAKQATYVAHDGGLQKKVVPDALSAVVAEARDGLVEGGHGVVAARAQAVPHQPLARLEPLLVRPQARREEHVAFGLND